MNIIGVCPVVDYAGRPTGLIERREMMTLEEARERYTRLDRIDSDRRYVLLEDYMRVQKQLEAAVRVVQAAHKLSHSLVGFGSAPDLGASGVLMVALNECLHAYDVAQLQGLE